LMEHNLGTIPGAFWLVVKPKKDNNCL
jgi:hypothetical protein